MNKYDRVQFGEKFGLNTEDSILINSTDNVFKYNSFLSDLDNCSIRTFRGADRVNPHFPLVNSYEAKMIIQDLQKDNYSIILAKPINPEDCKFCGAVWQTLEKMVIEIADGPGTVRRVTHESKIDRRYVLDNFTRQMTGETEIDKIVRRLRATKLTNVIFEFSYYNIPVGKKKENFICWEVTDDGSTKSILCY